MFHAVVGVGRTVVIWSLVLTWLAMSATPRQMRNEWEFQRHQRQLHTADMASQVPKSMRKNMNQQHLTDKNKTQTRRLMMPREARYVGRKLLTQQCWCWGQDIKREAGNVLLQYGFSRQRPPAGESGATTYSLKLLPNAHISLWGFGLFYGEIGQGGVFIGRFNFEARFHSHWDLPRQVWAPPQIDEFLRVPSTQSERELTRYLLSRAVLWMERYESWVLQTHGIEYRCKCLEKFPQAVAPDVALQSWKPLSRAVLTARAAHRNSSDIEYSMGVR